METSPQIQTLCDSYLDAPATTVATNDTDNKKMIRHVKPALCNCANGYTEWISRTPPSPYKRKAKPVTSSSETKHQFVYVCHK